MPVRSPSPFLRLSRSLREQPPRGGLAGVAQRVALAVLPQPPLRPQPRSLPAPDESAVRRERARRALLEARRSMAGVLGDQPPAGVTESASTAEMPDLDRLRAAVEESDRERSALRAEIAALRDEMLGLRSRMQALERLLPAAAPPMPPQPSEATPAAAAEAAAESTPASDSIPGPEVVAAAAASESLPEKEAEATPALSESTPVATPAETPHETERPDDEAALRELRERVLRALRERVFAAGTVGTRVEFMPPPSPAELDEIIERLKDEPLLEHAEPLTAEAGATALRVTLRAPLRWEQFGTVLERALARPLGHGNVSWSHGAVRVRLDAVAAGALGAAATSEAPAGAT